MANGGSFIPSKISTLCEVVFVAVLPEPPFFASIRLFYVEQLIQATPSLDAWLKKATTDMTATNQHIRNSGRGNTHQTSHQYRIIKGLAKVAGWIIGLIVALIVWVILRPIFRGVGYVITILTMIVIIFWLLTNF